MLGWKAYILYSSGNSILEVECQIQNFLCEVMVMSVGSDCGHKLPVPAT